MTDTIVAPPRPPRDGLVRALPTLAEYREDDTDADATPKLRGHFAVFNEWAEIRSAYEGNFMERISPGAFTKTFAENRDSMKVMLDHGHGALVGQAPIGKIQELREDERGAYYEVGLFNGLPELVTDGLRAGEYGSSFRFTVTRDNVQDDPRKVANERGLPERTIHEAKVMEFGPVVFPAYEGATAGLRSESQTDEYILARFAADPEYLEWLVQRVLTATTQRDDDPITTTSFPQPTRPEDEGDESDVRTRTPLYTPAPKPVTPLYGMRDPRPAWKL